MTLTEAIKTYPGLSDISDNFIVKALVDRSVSDGSATYTAGYKKITELVVADIYSVAVTSPDVQEGYLSIKLPRSHMIALAAKYYTQHGEPEKAMVLKGGNVKDVTGRW